MFHQSELGNFSDLLPCDMNGQIPKPGDDWRTMAWGLESMDSCDADLIELLDDIWWPQLIKLASAIRHKVRQMQGEQT
ncbi:MAG: hypothetical protein ACTHK7_20240 [Aureliella sp.]